MEGWVGDAPSPGGKGKEILPSLLHLFSSLGTIFSFLPAATPLSFALCVDFHITSLLFLCPPPIALK